MLVPGARWVGITAMAPLWVWIRTVVFATRGTAYMSVFPLTSQSPKSSAYPEVLSPIPGVNEAIALVYPDAPDHTVAFVSPVRSMVIRSSSQSLS